MCACVCGVSVWFTHFMTTRSWRLTVSPRPPRGQAVGVPRILVSTEDHFESLWCQHNPVSVATASTVVGQPGRGVSSWGPYHGADVRHLRHPAINNSPCGSCASWEQSQSLPECETLGDERTMTADKCQSPWHSQVPSETHVGGNPIGCEVKSFAQWNKNNHNN